MGSRDLAGHRIQALSTAGVTGLATGAFLLSYDALHQLARTSHVPAVLAWLWPLIVDGFILVASLAVLDAVHTGRRAIYPWLLVLGFSALSVTFNVLHAPHNVVAQLVAAIPPLALVLSFELLMRQIHHRLQQTAGTPQAHAPVTPTSARTATIHSTKRRRQSARPAQSRRHQYPPPRQRRPSPRPPRRPAARVPSPKPEPKPSAMSAPAPATVHHRRSRRAAGDLSRLRETTPARPQHHPPRRRRRDHRRGRRATGGRAPGREAMTTPPSIPPPGEDPTGPRRPRGRAGARPGTGCTNVRPAAGAS